MITIISQDGSLLIDAKVISYYKLTYHNVDGNDKSEKYGYYFNAQALGSASSINVAKYSNRNYCEYVMEQIVKSINLGASIYRMPKENELKILLAGRKGWEQND